MSVLKKAHLDKYGVGFGCVDEMNSVKCHIGDETWQHFLLKCAICWRLRKEGFDFFTEVPLKNGRKPDIVDFTNNTCYELETKAKEYSEWYDKETEFKFIKIPVYDGLKRLFQNVENRERRTLRKQNNRVKKSRQKHDFNSKRVE